MAEKLDAGLSRDTAEYAASVKARGNNLAVNDKEHVHRADLVDILSVNAVEPEHLSIALLLGNLLRLH